MDEDKSKDQLIEELADLRRRIKEAEAEKARRGEAESHSDDFVPEYKNLVDTALVGFFQTNVSGDILYVNDAMVKILENHRLYCYSE